MTKIFQILLVASAGITIRDSFAAVIGQPIHNDEPVNQDGISDLVSVRETIKSQSTQTPSFNWLSWALQNITAQMENNRKIVLEDTKTLVDRMERSLNDTLERKFNDLMFTLVAGHNHNDSMRDVVTVPPETNSNRIVEVETTTLNRTAEILPCFHLTLTSSSQGVCNFSLGFTFPLGYECTTETGKLVWQYDHNLVIYGRNRRVLWTTATNGRGNRLIFQEDGNLVVYNNGNEAIWASHTMGSGFKMEFRKDRNFVIINRSGALVWQSGSNL